MPEYRTEDAEEIKKENENGLKWKKYKYKRTFRTTLKNKLIQRIISIETVKSDTTSG